MKTRNEEMNRKTAHPASAKARARRTRAAAGSLARKALSIAMSAILVVGLSPLTKASAAAGDGQASAQSSQDQLQPGTYWYNGDMSFTTIDSSNGFTSGAWDGYRDMGKDGSGNALGIAGSFHLVAFDTLSSSSHIYGNILANHVTNIQDYGVKPEFANIYGHGTLSYIQDYQAGNNRFGEQSYDNQAIVFGNNTDTFRLYSENSNKHDIIKFKNSVNASWGGSEVTFPRTIAQDLDTSSAPFIDMGAVKKETSDLSSKLSQHATNGVTYDFSDQNKKTISYTKGSGCAYLTLPLSALTQNGNPLYIKNLPLDGSAALVINVDCGGADAPIPDQVWLDAGNGQNAGLGENDKDTGYVLWNFTNAKTVTAMGMVSSILAPGATINLKGNSCGTFIGDNINVSGETHTRPFHGTFEDKEQPKTTSVSVSKQWLDSKGNAESDEVVKAHAGVKVQLYANGEKSGDEVELNAGNEWKHAWDGLPVKDDAGNAISYTVQEVSAPAGYTASVTGSGNAFTISNQHKPEASVSATKTWNDGDDIDQMRPTSVTARIMRTCEGIAEQVGALTLSADNGWQASQSGLPTESADGKQYTYSLQEDAVDGYTGTIDAQAPSKDANGNVSYSFTLVNAHTPSKVGLSVSKTWVDGDDQDGIRPTELAVDVWRTEGEGGAKTLVQTLVLTAEGGWKASLSDLPVWGKNGKYAYSVSEHEVKGYSGTVERTVDAATGSYAFALTNTHAVETTQVGVTKAWDDADDADGLRPSAVEVELLADGVATGKTLTLDAAHKWTGAWGNLAKKAGGKDIAYTVRENTKVEGYSATVMGGKVSDAKGFSYTLKNKHEQAKTSVSVTKEWNDGNDQDGIRPASVEVQLFRSVGNGDPVEMKGYKATLDENSAWKASWTGLPANEGGKAITYTVKETGSSPDYTCSISGNNGADGAFAYTLTNTHNADKTSVKVAKVWDDDGNQDGIRPGSVVVELVADGVATGKTLTLDAAGKWTASWDNLAKKAGGKDIAYTVREVPVDGYTTAVDGSAADGFTITNTHTPETVSVPVKKAWVDNGDHDGLRPGSVEVELLADGVATGRTLTLDAGDGWAGSFSGLAKKAGGKEIAYTVRENTKASGYTTAIDGSAADGFTITNTHETEQMSVSVKKTWADNGDQDGMRPASVQVQLYAGDQAVGEAVTLTAADGWTHTWRDLAKKAGGEDVAYTVKEVPVAGYTSAIAGDAETGFIVTNTHVPETTQINVEKKWVDDGNQDGIRPKTVTAQLLADGTVVRTAELSADNNWAYAWSDLPVYKEGKKIEYTVKEPSLPDGYKASVTGDAADGFTITNTHESATTSVSVAKAWNDADNQDGIRPTSVTVQLYADGTPTGDPVTLNAEGDWKHTWDKLDKFANGSEIAYTVKELGVPEGYTSAITGSAATGFTIANSHTAKTTGISVKKVWSDSGNQDGIRPETVTAQLLADGAVVRTVELSADNNWAYAWSDLPVCAGGKEITYTVQEAGTPEGYTASVSGNVANGFTITNTHAAAETAVSVHKVWKDADGNDQSGVHPAVTAQLYRSIAGGEPEAMAGYTVTLDEEHGWAASWTKLPVKSDGKDIAYSVQEADVSAGYTSAVTPDGESSYAFTLTNTAEKRVAVSVAKAWDDGDNADGVRPGSVTAQLCMVDAQNNPVPVAGKTVELSAANNWAYTWDDLAAIDAEGNAIAYTVQEANVPAGYEGVVSGGQVEGGDFAFTLNNTHKLKTVDINVSKVWNDQDDVDGLRPDSVTAQLCSVNAAGETVPVEGAEQKVLDAGNGWAAGWKGLVANEDGKAIKYTVREVEVPEGYTSSVTGLDNGDGTYSFMMTNTHEVEVAEFALSGYSVRSITAPVPEADKVCYVDPKISKTLVGRTLEDGEFTFQLIDKATGALVTTASNDALGTVDFDKAGNLAADGMEPCCLKLTSPGTYTYEVREAPGEQDPTVDYSNERIEFVVTVEDVDGALKATDMHYVHYKDAADTVGTIMAADSHPSITNRVKAIELGLTKTDADTGAALPGATYGLFRADSASPEGAVQVAKATSDANGHMTFTSAGEAEAISTGIEYWFEELSAPEGYVRSLDETAHFQIERVGTGKDTAYQLAYADGSKGELYSVGTVIEFGDGKTSVTDKPLTASIAKVDSARNALAGAKLGVRLADGTDPIDEWTSNGAGHVLSGLKADTRYVLYEASAPDGFEKAADVTFTVDEFGTIKLVDGAWGENVLNAYATDGSLSLVDYSHSEQVEKKVQQREQTKTTSTSGKKGSLTQTGDKAPVLPLVIGAVAALVVVVIAAVALAKRRKR